MIRHSLAILEKCRTGKRDIGGEEITRSLVPADAGRSEPRLEEGIVREPADVDMGLILGIGFPPQHGGLLRWADTLGLAKILERLAKYESLGKRFQPTEQMRKLAAANKGFFPA